MYVSSGGVPLVGQRASFSLSGSTVVVLCSHSRLVVVVVVVV